MFKIFANKKTVKKIAVGLISLSAAGGTCLAVALNSDLLASDHGCKPANYPWFHKGFFNTLDHASVRRGYEVYKQVCAACHSMQFTYYRQLVDVTHTEDEVKAEAAEATVQDGPNEEGNYFMRPGKPSDKFPSPYPNKEAGKFANNGAFPPDLSFIAFARHNAANYIFALLTGYQDPPAGVETKEGVHYNPYFAGGWTSMAKALYDDVIEYSDGTPATTSQLAKDVVEFLRWSAEKSHDDRKYKLLQLFIVGPPVLAVFYYYKRRIFSVLKTGKMRWQEPKDRHSGGGGGGH